MSKLLHDSIEAGSVWVTTRVAGEVQINFKDKSMDPLIVRSGSELELLARATATQLRKSNLANLLTRRVLRLVIK